MTWLGVLSGKKNNGGKKIFYWLLLTSDGKLHRSNGEGPDKGTRTLPDIKKIKALETDPKAHISMEEVNSYYFESDIDREAFLKKIKTRISAPNPIRKKPVDKTKVSSELDLQISEKPKIPVSSSTIKSSNKSKDDLDAEKTLLLGTTTTSELTVSQEARVYKFEIVDKQVRLARVSLSKVLNGFRAEVVEGEQSDLKRAESGDLRSKELLTIYFTSIDNAQTVFQAYKEKAKTRNTKIE